MQMTTAAVEDFIKYLAGKKYFQTDAQSALPPGADKSLRRVWEATELTASSFADEVARFLWPEAASIAPPYLRRAADGALFAPLLARQRDLSFRIAERSL